MSIFSGIEQFGSLVGSKINSAFDASNHGFLSGNWDDFQLGLTRIGGAVPNVISNNIQTISKGTGQGFKNLLDPLTYSPSFYILAGGGILILLMLGYTMIKVGKYI